jgi:flagellar hook assembly protein FlgD
VLNTSHVELKIFNVTGQLVETLASQEFAAGEHSIQWNAGKYASGLYLAQITIGPDVSLKKILLLK